MSVYYLIIADKPSNKILGEYCDVSQGGSIQEVNTVKAKGQELFGSTTETQTQNSSTELTNFTLYYILTSSNTFYYVAVNKKLQEVVKSNMIFELIEDLEHQGIKLQVDKVNEGQFSSVGQQNLKFTIDKYITSQITKGEPSNRVNTLRSETEANIVTTQTNEPIDVSKGGEEEKNNVHKRRETTEPITKEDMIQGVSSGNVSLDVSTGNGIHPYQATYDVVLRKTRCVRLVILVIGIITGCLAMFQILNE